MIPPLGLLHSVIDISLNYVWPKFMHVNGCHCELVLRMIIRKHYVPYSAPSSYFLISFSTQRSQGFSETWLILGNIGQGIYKMSLQDVVGPEGEKVYKIVLWPEYAKGT